MKRISVTIATVVISCIVILKLFINADSTCGSSSCNVPNSGFQAIRFDTGPFAFFSGPTTDDSNSDIRFNYGLCLPWQTDDDLLQYMNWTQVFYNSFTVFIKTETTDCSATRAFSYKRYCSQNGSITAQNLNDNGTLLNSASQPSYNSPYTSSIYIDVPKDRPFRVTFTIYTRCDYCNYDDPNNKYNLVFQTSQTYAKNAWNEHSGYLLFTFHRPINCVVDNAVIHTAHQDATPWNHCTSNSCQ